MPDSAPPILGTDRTKWKALGPDWAAFVNFWSETHNNNDLRNRLYPDVLDLQLLHDTQKYSPTLVNMSNKILVTQSYVDLYERIKSGFNMDSAVRPDGARITRRIAERNGVIITGQPGTGKSCSLWYIAIRLLQDFPLEPLLFIQQGSVLLFYERNVYTLSMTTTTLIGLCQLPIHIFSYHQNGCIALIDGDATDALDYLEWGWLLPIFATSPRSKGIEHFVKRRDPFIWGMPTWTQLELRKGFEIQHECTRTKEALLALGSEALRGFDSRDSLSDSVQEDWLPLRAEPEAEIHSLTTDSEWYLMKFVERAVRRVGWVPRDVYQFMARPVTFDSRVQGDLRRMEILQILYDLVGPLNIPTSPLSHQVFMQHALSQNNLEDTKFVIHFRTKSTEDFYFKKLDWSCLREVLRITQKYPKAHSLGGIVFEAIAHKVLPTLSCISLFRMTEEPKKKKMGVFVRYLSTENSPKAIKVDFVRTDTISFQSFVPKQIQLSNYYKGCRMTPLIDGFLLKKTNARKPGIILYFLLITTSQKKKPHSLISGPELLSKIVEKVKLTYKLPVTVCFVLVGPAEDILAVEPDQSWELPDSDFLGFPYKVYLCEIPIPDSLPHLGASDEGRSTKRSKVG